MDHGCRKNVGGNCSDSKMIVDNQIGSFGWTSWPVLDSSSSICPLSILSHLLIYHFMSKQCLRVVLLMMGLSFNALFSEMSTRNSTIVPSGLWAICRSKHNFASCAGEKPNKPLNSYTQLITDSKVQHSNHYFLFFGWYKQALEPSNPFTRRLET